MFTGIIETLGTVEHLEWQQSNLFITIASDISQELKVDQSVAHDGVCLTVVDLGNGRHTVTAINETLNKTNLGQWKVGDRINLERCMVMNGRLDGHLVQGHVDTTARCESIQEQNGSWTYTFIFPIAFDALVISKGSICVNGTSLTVVNPTSGQFSVAIIPYTYEHTNFHRLKAGDLVNLEFDIIGKYIVKNLEHYMQK